MVLTPQHPITLGTQTNPGPKSSRFQLISKHGRYSTQSPSKIVSRAVPTQVLSHPALQRKKSALEAARRLETTDDDDGVTADACSIVNPQIYELKFRNTTPAQYPILRIS